MRAAIVSLVLFLCGVTCMTGQESSLPPSPLMPTNAETLRTHFQSMLEASKSSDKAPLHKLEANLRLPNPRDWFMGNFEGEAAKSLTQQYDRAFESFCSRFEKNCERFTTHAELHVEEFQASEKEVSTSTSTPVPRSAVHITSFRFVVAEPGIGKTVWTDSFVLVDGGLRFIGGGAFPFWTGPLQVRACTVVGAKLKKRVEPEYPLAARRNHIGGTVVISAVIGKDGTLIDPKAIAGPEMLQKPAVDAVKKWIYRPALCNGQPAEVHTTININFR